MSPIGSIVRSSSNHLVLTAHPGESFTARTLRLDVRPLMDPAIQAQAPVVVETLDLAPRTPESATLLVRIQAETALFPADSDNDMNAVDNLPAQRRGIAGTVEAIAGCAGEFDIGDAVFGVTSASPFRAGQLTVIEARSLARMPSRLRFKDAASSSLAGASAWKMLFAAGRLDSGETVLILGANTPIGAFAVQLAAVHGVRTIALVTSPGNERELLSYGAHCVIDASPGRLETQCRSVSLVVDAVGGALHRRAAAALQSGCTLVSCVQRPEVFIVSRRRTRSLFCVPDATTHCLARIATLIDDGHITTCATGSEPCRD